jgi:hypothetical protein
MVKSVIKFAKVVSHTGINNHVERGDYCKDNNPRELGDQANIQSMVTLVVKVDILPTVTTANTGTLLYYNTVYHGNVPKQINHKYTRFSCKLSVIFARCQPEGNVSMYYSKPSIFTQDARWNPSFSKRTDWLQYGRIGRHDEANFRFPLIFANAPKQ